MSSVLNPITNEYGQKQLLLDLVCNELKKNLFFLPYISHLSSFYYGYFRSCRMRVEKGSKSNLSFSRRSQEWSFFLKSKLVNQLLIFRQDKSELLILLTWRKSGHNPDLSW